LTRRFYTTLNYAHEATIRDYYKDGEDKIVFWKRLI
jgi:ribosomal protein S18 acetylase RimI-like enzyme